MRRRSDMDRDTEAMRQGFYVLVCAVCFGFLLLASIAILTIRFFPFP